MHHRSRSSISSFLPPPQQVHPSASASSFIVLPADDASSGSSSAGGQRPSHTRTTSLATRGGEVEKLGLLREWDGKEQQGKQQDGQDEERGATLLGAPQSGAGDWRTKWAYVLPIWILSLVLGFLLTMSNKYILSMTPFHYPVTLTTSHMAFAVLATRLLALLGPRCLGREVIDTEIAWDQYVRNVLPIGVLFSASLCLSNSAMLLLSVSLVQMLKAFIPALILVLSALLGLRKLNLVSVAVILIISSGCALAAFGEVHFSMVGLGLQVGAMLAESTRMVLIQVLLQGQKMDPLTSLYHYAPVCLGLNLLLIPLLEGSAPLTALLSSTPSLAPLPSLPSPLLALSPLLLLANAATAFSLNVVALFLIQIVGGVAQSLAGVLKDIALIAGSVVWFGSVLGVSQVFGYALSLAGLIAYRYHSSRR